MAELTIRIPREHVGAVRDALLHHYASVSEAVHHVAGDLASTHDGLEMLVGHQRELVDLEDALNQLGWSYGEPDDAISLTAHPEVLSDATHAALDDAIEALEAAMGAYWHGDLSPAEAGTAIGVLLARFELFDKVQRGVSDEER